VSECENHKRDLKKKHPCCLMSYCHEDRAVGIATSHGLDDPEGSEFESQQGQEFSLPHIVQTGSGVHPTYPMGTVGLPGVKGKATGARS
jgi:hypothetical protein